MASKGSSLDVWNRVAYVTPALFDRLQLALRDDDQGHLPILREAFGAEVIDSLVAQRAQLRLVVLHA